jgi:hypothetical protein
MMIAARFRENILKRRKISRCSVAVAAPAILSKVPVSNAACLISMPGHPLFGLITSAVSLSALHGTADQFQKVNPTNSEGLLMFPFESTSFGVSADERTSTRHLTHP